ncbi:MAG: YerC/YecD family TrpR-related protein [Candidatus Heritagella sp.]
MANPYQRERSMALYKAIAKLQTVEDCCRFFDDLCAVTELRALEQRFDVAMLLHEGMVYTDIMREVNASSATISRVKRVMNLGTGALSEMVAQVSAEKKAQSPKE